MPMILNGLDLFMDLIMKSKYIVSIIGAGISTSAGIPDFRGPNGLYSRKDVPAEKLFDIGYFRSDPSLFYSHAAELVAPALHAKPTLGHLFLRKLEDLGKLKMTVSQNIDGLHEVAGLRNVIDIHGNFRKYFCVSCGAEHPEPQKLNETISASAYDGTPPKCPACGGVVKPDVVFFGEPVKDLERALTEVQRADLLICIGSSLTVYPVSTLPSYLADASKLVIINADETPYDDRAKVVIHDDIDGTVDKLHLL
jgi:NAD-dependent deacetylase